MKAADIVSMIEDCDVWKKAPNTAKMAFIETFKRLEYPLLEAHTAWHWFVNGMRFATASIIEANADSFVVIEINETERQN